MLLPACASIRPVELVQQKEITLEQALLSVGCGLKAMDEAPGTFRTGLYPVEVEIKLELSASASDSGKLTVATGALNSANKVAADYGNDSKATRLNTITIKFSNIMALQAGALVNSKTPEDYEKIMAAIKSSGIRVFDGDRLAIVTSPYRCK